MARIKEVAKRAGVSTATVSRVINESSNVSPHLRECVLAAIAELHYSPSRLARHLRSQSTRTIGLIISDIQNPFFTSLVRGVEDVAYQNGYSILLCNADEDPTKEQLYVEVLRAERVAGAIVACTSETCCQALLEFYLTWVAVDRRVSGREVDTVVVDNVAGARQAGPEPPTALFVANNLMTMGALQALQEHAVRIPQDISVVGFDDVPWMSLLQPPLTTVRQPTYQIGKEAAELLFRRLREGPQKSTERIILQPELIIRGSTAAPVN
jgi:DNA-binding LacI/PurR family transcriptional regulator